MLKRILSVHIVLILIFTQNVFAYPTIAVNEKPVSFPISPMTENGRILVPSRAIFEALGATALWDTETQTITAKMGTSEIKLIIGGLAYKNGQAIELATPARVNQGNPMVPLRFVAEALDFQVAWDDTSGMVAIFSAKPSGVPIQPPPDDYSANQKVQYYLSEMGFITKPSDASQREVVTASSAILFQFKKGLKITGKFDAATRAALEKCALEGWTYKDIMNQKGQPLPPLSKNKEINGKLDITKMVVMPAVEDWKVVLPAYTAVGWATLVQAAAKDLNNDMSAFLLVDGYRSYEEQVILFQEDGAATAAVPGNSRHGWGLAIDFNFSDEQSGRAQSHELKWMEKNASAFGFTPNKSPLDGRPWEPYFPDGNINFWETWHWNYSTKR